MQCTCIVVTCICTCTCTVYMYMYILHVHVYIYNCTLQLHVQSAHLILQLHVHANVHVHVYDCDDFEFVQVYNLVGVVRSHSDEEASMVEVEFHNTSTHHSFSLPNPAGYSMASLSEQALVLASEKQEEQSRLAGLNTRRNNVDRD